MSIETCQMLTVSEDNNLIDGRGSWPGLCRDTYLDYTVLEVRAINYKQ